MKSVFVFMVLCFSAWSQNRVNNNDLRKFYNLFYIKDLSDKAVMEYRVNSSGRGQFNLEVLNKQKVTHKLKMDSKQASMLDEQFVDKFISFKYFMRPTSRKKCKDRYYLSLRGEEFVICETEKDKIKELNVFLEKLKVLL